MQSFMHEIDIEKRDKECKKTSAPRAEHSECSGDSMNP